MSIAQVVKPLENSKPDSWITSAAALGSPLTPSKATSVVAFIVHPSRPTQQGLSLIVSAHRLEAPRQNRFVCHSIPARARRLIGNLASSICDRDGEGLPADEVCHTIPGE